MKARKPTEHVVKCWPEYFDAMERGDKCFEVRRDDRGYQGGDILILQRTREDSRHQIEYGIDGKPRRELRRRIRWILTGGQFGIEPGYVVMQLDPK